MRGGHRGPPQDVRRASTTKATFENANLTTYYHYSVKRFLSTVSLIAIAAVALVPISQAQSSKIPFSQFSLDNGLRVVLSEDHSAPVVAVAVYYDVGSR